MYSKTIAGKVYFWVFLFFLNHGRVNCKYSWLKFICYISTSLLKQSSFWNMKCHDNYQQSNNVSSLHQILPCLLLIWQKYANTFDLFSSSLSCCDSASIFYSHNKCSENLEMILLAIYKSEWKKKTFNSALNKYKSRSRQVQYRYVIPSFSRCICVRHTDHLKNTTLADQIKDEGPLGNLREWRTTCMLSLLGQWSWETYRYSLQNEEAGWGHV